MSDGGLTLRLVDRYDRNCYLVVTDSGNGEVGIHGWNNHSDGFTGIDLAPDTVAQLAEFLRQSSLT